MNLFVKIFNGFFGGAFVAVALILGVVGSPSAIASDNLVVNGGIASYQYPIDLNGTAGDITYGNLITPGDDEGAEADGHTAVKITGGKNTVNISGGISGGRIEGLIDVQVGEVLINNHGRIGLPDDDDDDDDDAVEDDADFYAIKVAAPASPPAYEGDGEPVPPNPVRATVNNYGEIIGSISSKGSLYLENSGTITGGAASGALEIIAGETTFINRGIISAKPPLSDDDDDESIAIAIGSAGRLTLTNDGVINGDINNNGVLNVERGGSVAGNFSNNGTGTLNLDTNNIKFIGNYSGSGEINLTITREKQGRLDAQEIVLSDTKVNVTAKSGVAGEAYTVIHADGKITNSEDAENIKIDNQTRTLDFRTFIDDHDVIIKTSAIPNAISNLADEQQKRMGGELDRIAADNVPAMSSLMWRLNSITDKSEFQNALRQLDNRQLLATQNRQMTAAINAHNSVLQSALRDLTGKNFGAFSQGLAINAPTRVARVRGGGGTGDANFDRWNTFARIYGGFGENFDRDGSTKSDHIGALIGMDYRFAKELRVGAFFNFTHGTAKIDAGAAKNVDNVFRLGAYGNWNWDGIYIDAAPSFGLHRLTGERKIRFSDETLTAKNERWAGDLSLLLNAGYTINLPFRTYFTPEFSLAPSLFYSPSYTESGADTANLKMNDYYAWSFLQTLNFKAGGIFDFGIGTKFQPEFHIGWEHEYVSDTGDIKTEFAAAPGYAWTGDNSDGSPRDRMVFGLSIGALISPNFTIAGRWEHRLWEGGYDTDFSLSATLSY